jgi:hypothetical protein
VSLLSGMKPGTVDVGRVLEIAERSMVIHSGAALSFDEANLVPARTLEFFGPCANLQFWPKRQKP